MKPDNDIFSYQSLVNRWAAEQLAHRAIGYLAQVQNYVLPKDQVGHDFPEAPGLSLDRISAPGVDLTNAALYLYPQESESNGTAEHAAETTLLAWEIAEREYWSLSQEEREFSHRQPQDLLNGVSQTSLCNANLPFGLLAKTSASFARFVGANLCFASFARAGIRYADFSDALLAGTDFEGADIGRARFTLSPALLTANFKDVRNIDYALFYMNIDGREYRIRGLAVGPDGRLVPAQNDKALDNPGSISGAFSEAALADSRHFSEIYDLLKPEADLLLKGLVDQIKAAPKTESAPDYQQTVQRFLDRHAAQKKAANKAKDSPAPQAP
jgi:hypothetical protein